MQDKVTHVAAKGQKAFLTLLQKAKHSAEDLKSPRGTSEAKSSPDADDDAAASSEPAKKSLSLPKSPRAVPKSPRAGSELQPNETDSGESDGPSPKTSMERKGKLVDRLKRGLKVGKKSSDAENRSELLDENDQSPRVRSTDSIKAAYGHKPSTDPTSIAAMNRENLIERQEKLQAMNKQSEEMAEGAGDFASIAEELAKRIENKPWYKL